MVCAVVMGGTYSRELQMRGDGKGQVQPGVTRAGVGLGRTEISERNPIVRVHHLQDEGSVGL